MEGNYFYFYLIVDNGSVVDEINIDDILFSKITRLFFFAGKRCVLFVSRKQTSPDIRVTL